MSDDIQDVAPQEDSADEFEKAFAEFSGAKAEGVEDDAPAEQDEPEQTDEPQAEDAPAPEQEDPFAGLSEAQKKIVREMQQKLAAADHEIRSNRGRIAALQRKAQEATAPAKQEPQRDLAQPAGVSDKRWEDFKKDFPEVAEVFEAKLKHMEQLVDQRLGQATQPIKELEHRQYLQGQYAALEAAHPDWQQAVKSNEFRSWLSAQPTAVQQILQSEDASEASWLLGRFKQDVAAIQAQRARQQSAPAGSPAQTNVGQLNEQRNRRLQQSAGIGSAKSTAGQSGPPDDFDAAFDYFARKKAAR